jgi:hypothetical protein
MLEDLTPTIDAIDLLQRDHDEIRRLVAALERPPSDTALIAGVADRIRDVLVGRNRDLYV